MIKVTTTGYAKLCFYCDVTTSEYGHCCPRLSTFGEVRESSYCTLTKQYSILKVDPNYNGPVPECI